MFCAAILVSGQCLFACEGFLQEFNQAWNWPARVRWNSDTQALVDDYGVLPKLYRRGDHVIWQTPTEPTYCDDVQRSRSGGRLPRAAPNLSGSPVAAGERANGATDRGPERRVRPALAGLRAKHCRLLRCHAGSCAAVGPPSTTRACCAAANCRRR
jgi:hypothetical protein